MTEKKLLIRRALPTDADAIAAAEAAVFPVPYNERAVSDMLTVPYGRSLVCEDDKGRFHGYLLGTCIPPEGELLRIAVLPDDRGQGAGRLLTESFLTLLEQEGCEACYLDVREHNMRAQALYTSCGFVFCGRRKNYYRFPTEDALEMIRTKEKEPTSAHIS